ncbi:T9SS type A sorting domain-containing protein [Aequorivita sp. CIP111184]|uniref:T9SS type A sorting domain-containing protein n=1 Tax=Aequorivita sp. CIP111184 TaxID=2211356 RepID=UPI000DBBB47D|nr:T9SS type A sorting domain-containing protein [Aequorivita sp. CIP111184]SRX55796.1 hypothetical protein AEQU1_02821 [Aequorivita sp. CIP111184]
MKNLLLFSTLLLTSFGAFAQLTVKPTTAGADSYVYVNDQVLYVKNEINLTRNPSGPSNTEASIYLRNNGQLIQSGVASTNTGNGQLSVQQNTLETNRWGYYLWCSPIGNTVIGSSIGNTNFGIGSVYQPTSATSATLALTTTGPDGILSPFTVSTRWLYTFETPGTEIESHYRRINGGNSAPPGFGYTMKGVGNYLPGDNFNYDFRGRPNSGDFNIPVGIDLMTLSGNPYPSALDLNKLFYDSDNTELKTFWYYDEDRSVGSHNYSGKPFGYGVYAVGPEDTDNDPSNGNNMGIYTSSPFRIYTSGGGTSPPGSTPSAVQGKRFAPVGQGIMLVGDAVGFITIKNLHRVFVREGLANGSVFQRPNIVDNTATEENLNGTPTLSTDSETTGTVDYRTPMMRLWTVFDDAVTRDMVLAFYDQATDGYDRGLDGLSAQDLKTDAYFPIGNDNNRKPYVINGIKYNKYKQVPIAFKLNKQTNIALRVQEEIKKPYQHAYLFDNQENTYKELGLAATTRPTLTLPAGTYDNRFFIVFRNPNIKSDIPKTELERTVVVRENVTFFQNNPQQQLEVGNPEGYTIKTALVYDMSGKLVISESNLGDNNKYSFYTGNLSDGVYLVKLMTSEDIAIDYKAIVHNQ